MSGDRIHVKIGELRVAVDQGTLYSIGLGSCVAVALYDARMKVCGLAHIMLPERTNGTVAPGRCATTAVPTLIDMMVEAGARRRGMFARIAGGAAMFRDVLPIEGARLGERNVAAVKHALAAAAIPVQAEDVGGTFGRSVYLDAGDGKLLVRAVRRSDVVL